MKLFAHSELSAEDINKETLPPAFRRASLNMTMATLGCEQILNQLPKDAPKEQISVIMATHFGEVSTTLEFLCTYHETQVPRPILFQNSLHNSTLGFVSIHLGMTGPSMTISCDRDTEASALLMCETLLEVTPYVLLCFVDSVPSALSGHYLETYPFLNKFLNKALSFLYVGD